jgi:UDP-N-acetylglucosamine--dolichyl-phosphate N-acetylglucosaminephosphotransferase
MHYELAALYIGCVLIAYLTIKIVSHYNKKVGIVGTDINKKDKPALPESAGIALLLPLWIVTISMFINTNNTAFLAWATMVSGFSIVGFIDDTKHKFSAKTIPWKLRAMIIAVISLLFSFLFFDGNLMLVVLASLYLAGVASFENTFAGLNGWEVGSGFIISFFIALILSRTVFFPLALALNASVLALLILNRYPAKVFPGDSGTLLIGSAMAGLVIMQSSLHLMIITFLFFIPHIIDFALKIVTNPQDPSQRKEYPYVLNEEGKLEIPKSKKLDFAKLLILIFGPKSERIIVLIIWCVVILNCLFWYLLL